MQLREKRRPPARPKGRDTSNSYHTLQALPDFSLFFCDESNSMLILKYTLEGEGSANPGWELQRAMNRILTNFDHHLFHAAIQL